MIHSHFTVGSDETKFYIQTRQENEVSAYFVRVFDESDVVAIRMHNSFLKMLA